MVDAKNIIIIGKTGSGKSALANVLSRTDEFKEDNTVGLGDKRLIKNELLEKFEEEIGIYIEEGISQIFFVIGEKMDQEVLTEFLWLNDFLFDNKAFDYTTVVRTNFTDFRNKDKREEDISDSVNFFSDNKEGYEEINNKVLKKGKIIHVNNPPISDENYPLSERKNKTVLNVSGQELKGTLRLKGFINLKRLNCADNQLTNLDLSDCPNLIEIDFSNNELTNLNFLKSVDKVEHLNVSNCPLKGNLKFLATLTNLEVLLITNTSLDDKGLEHLPTSCKKLICNSNPPTKIMEELSKYFLLSEVTSKNSLANEVKKLNLVAGRGLVGISGILGVSGSLVFEGRRIGAVAVASPLLGILKKITTGKLGEINKKLKELKIKVKAFLKKYDGDGNGTIDVSELTKLEAELINYRQNSSLMEADEEAMEENQEANQTAKETQINIDSFQEKDSIQALVQISSK
ncbi:11933_t:CDS:2 [Funneliformis geosporum]|uniref:16820_t:CDS:1 n=1 Tax=Funneliformis geosporum TaxID=1117311 RepID=A0A9W4WRX4_9GLOM|nr:11933_t:CDS:2 [Funneliformis geosporum]CAI2182130.1 16820_t:CDS:2 [Funneliformis geosporum]